MQRQPMTRAGYERLKNELRKLKTIDRRDVAREIEIARGHGDLRENADYDAAKEKQGMLEANIRDLEDHLARAEVIEVDRMAGDRVIFGATVTVHDDNTDEESTLTIVGEAEADLKVGRISVTSPLARALIGKRVDDEVKVQTPGGVRNYTVLEIAFE